MRAVPIPERRMQCSHVVDESMVLVQRKDSRTFRDEVALDVRHEKCCDAGL